MGAGIATGVGQPGKGMRGGVGGKFAAAGI